MFQGNLSCLFRKKTNKVKPQETVNIKVWENKKVIHEVEVEFDDLKKKSDYISNHKIKKNMSTIYNDSS
tara:strand:+ start:243 stop:449 length:207 start_codon:yes stop_codon:yes gene_type:complete